MTKTIRFTILLTLWTLLFSHCAFASTIFRTVENASEGCVLVAVDGQYVADAAAALNRINEIRKEACSQGVPDPRNSSQKLTPSDYVPIKWSSDLEYIARVRAAESSLVTSHTRPNGRLCFSVTSPRGISSNAEVLAWNSSSSAIYGINQWYSEKGDWVNATPGAVTGHYTSMINPSNTYVGIGCFLTTTGVYYNTTSGEFKATTSLDETPGSSVPDCRVIVEIEKSAISSPKLVTIQDTTNLDIGDTLAYDLGMKTSLEGESAFVFDAGTIEWSSSDDSVASVDGSGNVRINGVGTVKIAASSDSGFSAEVTLTPQHTAGSMRTVEKATRNKDGKRVKECSKCGKIMWEGTIPKIEDVHLSNTVQTYTGKLLKPGVLAYDVTGKTIKAKVSYRNNVNIGEGTVVVSFTGDYDDNVELGFKIIPAKVKWFKVTAGKKSIKASWKTANIKKGGYEIRYGLDKKMKKSVRIKKVKTVSKTIGGLKANKIYYVQIRAIATVNGKEYVSEWSEVKKVKTLK